MIWETGELTFGPDGGDAWGVAFPNLFDNTDELHPAVALYQSGDKVTIMPADAESSTGHLRSGAPHADASSYWNDSSVVLADCGNALWLRVGDRELKRLRGLSEKQQSLPASTSDYCVHMLSLLKGKLESQGLSEEMRVCLFQPFIAALVLSAPNDISSVLSIIPSCLSALQACSRASAQRSEVAGDFSGTWVLHSKPPFAQTYVLRIAQTKRGELDGSGGALKIKDMSNPACQKGSKKK